jgi:hypothetical protein
MCAIGGAPRTVLVRSDWHSAPPSTTNNGRANKRPDAFLKRPQVFFHLDWGGSLIAYYSFKTLYSLPSRVAYSLLRVSEFRFRLANEGRFGGREFWGGIGLYGKRATAALQMNFKLHWNLQPFEPECPSYWRFSFQWRILSFSGVLSMCSARPQSFLVRVKGAVPCRAVTRAYLYSWRCLNWREFQTFSNRNRCWVHTPPETWSSPLNLCQIIHVALLNRWSRVHEI